MKKERFQPLKHFLSIGESGQIIFTYESSLCTKSSKFIMDALKQCDESLQTVLKDCTNIH